MRIIKKIVLDSSIKFWIIRHLLFWLAFFYYFTFLTPDYSPTIAHKLKVNILFIPVDMMFVYFIIYLIYPLFFKQNVKVVYPILLFIVLTLSHLSISLYMESIIIDRDFNIIPSASRSIRVQFIFYFSALFIKTMKYLYLREMNIKDLEKQNIENKMQLLTSQLHPHFLFNTLNNVYSLSVSNSNKVSEIILKFSTVLRYILDDYNGTRVSLSKELDIVKYYTEIETLRYSNDLTVEYIEDLQGNDKEVLCIPPLLIFTFIENAFKHGVSNSVNDPWIYFKIKSNDAKIFIEIKNSMDNYKKSVEKRKHIGLKNVRDRLSLYFPDKHTFKVDEQTDSFSIYLEIKK